MSRPNLIHAAGHFSGPLANALQTMGSVLAEFMILSIFLQETFNF